jgi:putative transferase (TIGR04331 family)
MSSILTLTNNLNYLKSTNEKIIVLDKIYDLKKIEDLNYKNIHVIQNKCKDKKELIDTFEYCNNIYVKLLKDLTIELNRIHGLKKNIESWEVIIGKWLLEFIYICHKNFLLCQKALKENQFEKIIMIEPNSYSLHVGDTEDFSWATNDSSWNLCLNSKIVEFLNSDKNKIYIKPNQKSFIRKKNKIGKFNYFVKIIFKFINKLFKFKKIVLIYSSSFKFLEEKKIEVSLGQLPRFWPRENLKINFFDKNLRKELYFKKKTDDKFLNFLRFSLPDAIPLYILESFEDINKQMKKMNFPINPSKVFTCYGYAYDEIFKYFLSDIVEKKIPIFIGQHGNNYFTTIYSKHHRELNHPYKFISWGVSNEKKNIFAGFNFNTCGKVIDYNPQGKLLIVTQAVGVSISPFERNIKNEKNAETVCNLINSLNAKKEFIELKLHYTHKQMFDGFYFNRYYKNLNVKKNFHDNIFKLLKKSRLVFFNYDSTGLLENLSLNIPSVCLWHDTYSHLNEDYVKKYKKLVEAKILFEDFDQLLDHINKYWDNIDQWWLSTRTQKIIKEFNNNFNINNQNYKNLTNILK